MWMTSWPRKKPVENLRFGARDRGMVTNVMNRMDQDAVENSIEDWPRDKKW
jgi:hypothetical protein